MTDRDCGSRRLAPNNPGFVNLKLNVSYDSNAFTLTNVEDAGILGSAYHVSVNQDSPADCPYVLSWSIDPATENLTVNSKMR